MSVGVAGILVYHICICRNRSGVVTFSFSFSPKVTLLFCYFAAVSVSTLFFY